MTKHAHTRATDPAVEIDPLAHDPNEFLEDPTDYDPRKAAFGTPIGFPDPAKDYPTEGTPYPPPTP